MEHRIIVRDIRPPDIGEIVLINHAASPGVATLDLAAAETLIAAASVAWAAVESERIVGYLIAMLPAVQYDGDEFLWFKRRGADFVYVDQIALAARCRGRGIGRVLYESLEKWARGNGGRTLACEVNLEPPNPGSLAFHARCGFIEVGRMLTSDGRHAALLERDIS
jgi:predicted GNAT superfamily acetyltransferase